MHSTLALAMNEINKRVIEREVDTLQTRVDKRFIGEAEAPPHPLGVRCCMDLSADELQPAKHQTGYIAGEAEARDDAGEQENEKIAKDQETFRTHGLQRWR